MLWSKVKGVEQDAIVGVGFQKLLDFDIKEGPWESVQKMPNLCKTKTLKSFKEFGKVFFDDLK